MTRVAGEMREGEMIKECGADEGYSSLLAVPFIAREPGE